MSPRNQPNQPNARLIIALALASSTIGIAGAVFFLASAPTPAPEPTKAVASSPAIVSAEPVAAPTPVEPKPIPEVRLQPMKAGKLDRDRETSDRLRAQIAASLGQRGAPGSREADAPDNKAEPAPLPELDANYIRERIKEDLVPVAIECYESALADDPKLAGTLVVNFTILGEAEVGGVVDEATIDVETSTLDNEFLRECIRESMMAVNFEAPPADGRVEVTYPLHFEPDAEE